MRFIIILSLIFVYLANDTQATLTACPQTSSTTLSIRLNATLSASGMASYSGTLLTTSDGNFIFLLSVDDVGSPLSAVSGIWSCSSNTFTFTGKSFYFLQMSASKVTGLTCTYTAGSNNTALRSCTATYQILSNNQIGTATFALELKAP